MIHLTHLSILNPTDVNTLYDLLESRPLLPSLTSLVLIITVYISRKKPFHYPRRKTRLGLEENCSPTTADNSILPHLTSLVIGIHGLARGFGPPPIIHGITYHTTAFETLTALMSIIDHCKALLHLTFIAPASSLTVTDTTSNFLVLPSTLRSYTHVPNGTTTDADGMSVLKSPLLWRDNAGQQLKMLLRKQPSNFLKMERLGFDESWRDMVEEVLGKEKVGSVRLVGISRATKGHFDEYLRLSN